MNIVKSLIIKKTARFRKIQPSWGGVFFYTLLAISFYVFFEGIYILSRPSSFSYLKVMQKMNSLFFTNSLFISITVILLVLLFGLSRILVNKNLRRLIWNIALVIPSMICACFFLLQIDNVTYIFFYFGIVTSGTFRFFYIILFLFLLIYFYFQFAPNILELFHLIGYRIPHKYFIPALMALIICILAISYRPNSASSLTFPQQIHTTSVNNPNIILITADGLNATHMSAYGYERETTPRITELANDSLVGDNAFTNSAKTTGTIIALYTSRYSTSTNVLNPPDILKGEDSYLHLPGILRSIGYKTAQYTFPFYADAYDINLLNGFDTANGRSFTDGSLFVFLNQYNQTDNARFVYEISERLINRLGHIFYIQDMPNIQSLIQGKSQVYHDLTKIENAINLIADSNQPVFIHIHWMGTHGPLFNNETRFFSANRDQNSQVEWDLDYYDDSIIDFDNGIGYLIDELKRNDLYDNSIIIITGDHGMQWTNNMKIPLIMHFPGEEYTEHITVNVQTIDIAPTILDYLSVEIPVWMEGSSLLEPIEQRPVFSFDVLTGLGENGTTFAYIKEPPFYQFGNISVIYCNKYYRLDLINKQWFTEEIKGYTSPCTEETLPSADTVFKLMMDHLKNQGFNVENLSSADIMFFE